MVVRCLECKACSVFHAWIGVKSRVLEGCACPNQVYIDQHEKIHAQDHSKIEIWYDHEQDWISYERFTKLCSIRNAEHLGLTKSILV